MIQQMSAYGLFNSDQMNSLSHLSIAIMETAIDFMNRTAGRKCGMYKLKKYSVYILW